MKQKILILLMALFSLPSFARQRPHFYYEYEGQTLGYYIIDEEAKTCRTVEGTAWEAGNNVSEDLVIPAVVSDGEKEYTVKGIGDYSFLKTGLKSVVIPNTVEEIGYAAFENCYSLKSVNIPSSVTTIVSRAFWNCKKLESLFIPASVTSIGTEVFNYCGLKKSAYPNTLDNPIHSGVVISYDPDESIIEDDVIYNADKTEVIFVPIGYQGEFNMPSSVKAIGNDAFRFCADMASVTIPESVTAIGDNAFGDCSGLTSLAFNAENCTLGEGGFPSAISSLTIGEKVSVIPDGFLADGSGIERLDFPQTLVSIGKDAFPNSKLTSIIIPGSVTSVGENAFYGCRDLKEFKVEDGDSEIAFGPGALYGAAIDGLYLGKNWTYLGNESISTGIKSVEFGNRVTSFPANAFRNCKALTSVNIPESVRSIGESAFSGCTALTSMDIPNSVESIGESAFNGCTGLTSMDIPDSVESIGQSAFNGCTALTSVNLPNSLASIEKSTFEGCSALASVEIPQAVTSIGENAFKSCSAFQSIIIPSQVASIGQGAFSECSGLKKTLYPNTFDSPVSYGVKISYDPNDFSQEDGLAYNKDKSTLLFAPLSLTGECRVAASVDSIGEQAYANCGKITSLTIPENVRSIGNSAFEGCDGIKSVVLEDGASTLKMGNYISYDRNWNPLYNGLFSPCPLESIYVGRNLEYDVDGKDAPFARQLALNSVSFGNGVTSISDEMFYGCTALASIEFPESVESVGAFVFVGCTGLDNVVLPSSVNSIGKQAFDGCTGLKEISLPASLSSLSVGLFNGCTNLVKVVLPASLEIIGNQAFNDCESLSEIVLPATLERIGRMAFYNCGNLKEIVLPASVSVLGDGVFEGSTALSSIRCEGINPPAISETSVSNQYDKAHLFIPAGTISAYYSSLWRNFSNMNVGEYETKYYTDDVLKYLLVPDGTDHPSAIVVKGNYGALTEVTIPERFTDMSDPANPQRYYVTEIGYEAFKGLSKLQMVSFNSKSEVSRIGESAFEGCGCLSLISLPESLRRIENKAFYGCSLLLEVVFNEGLEYIGDYAFSKVLMGFITIPGSVKSIGDYAFSERNVGPYGADYLPLVQIVLGEGVETIGKGAFEIRSRGALLDKVSLPKSLKSIGANAFTGNLCPRIEISDLSAWCDIDFGGENANPTQYSSGDFPDYGYQEGYLYLNDKPLTNLVIPDGVKEVKPYAFNNLKTLKSVKFSDGVEGIGQKAFSSCDRLESISFNDGLSSIGEYAFSDCKKVGEISLPSSLASISAGAFYNTALNKVAIPASVVELGSYAFNTVSEVTFEDGVNEINVAGGFSNMKNLVWGRPSAGLLTMSTKNLESLVIGNVAEEVPEALCSGASNLSSLTLGSGLKSIGDNAFNGCKFSEVIVPPSVETIGASAFEGNAYLSSIIMGHSVTSIGEKAFNGCAANTVSITAQTPPTAPNTTFSNYTGKLYLQGKNAVDAYYDAYTCWDRFSGVVMIEPTGLDVKEKVVTGKAGDTFQLSAKLMPENVSLPQVFWRSTNPAIATVDGNGLVTLHADMEDMLTRGEEYSCKIIAESLYYDGPVAEIGVNNLDSGVEDVIFDSENGAVRPNDVYNMQGVCVKRNATQEDIDSLAPGLYIIGGKKVMIR